MTIAFVFPGQGSQSVGMGKAAYEASEGARRIFDEADAILGYPLSKICFEGPAEALDDTTVAQPAILTTSIALLAAFIEQAQAARPDGPQQRGPWGVAALPESLRPRFVAGHSLGEFSALVAAGVLSFGDALRLVAERGRLAATKGARGAMAAVVGLSAQEVETVITSSVPDGSAVVANDNGPEQVTIAGARESLALAADALVRRGAKKIVQLRISGPFHFPQMARIGDELRSFMTSLSFRDPVVPVVANVSARPHEAAETIPDMLVRHLSQRVEWLKSVRFMAERGASIFVEIGAGQVVNGLIKRIADAELLNVSDPPSIRTAIERLRARLA